MNAPCLRVAGDLKQQRNRAGVFQFAVLEQADSSVLAVVAGLPDHPSLAHAPDRLGHQRRSGAADVFQRSLFQDEQLGTDAVNQFRVRLLDLAALFTDAAHLGDDFRQRHQVAESAGPRRPETVRPVCQ